MNKNLTYLAIIFTVVMLIGCTGAKKPTNLSSSVLVSDPTISTYKDNTINFTKLNTFTVIPTSQYHKDIEMNEIMERQMLFFLRNLFEQRGYVFVELDQNPDFIVSLIADSKYKEKYVPPSTVTIPQFVPGQTITTYGSSSGNLNYQTYGSQSYYGSGTYSGTSSSTTYVPGYMSSQTLHRPGYTIGRHFPSVLVTVFEPKKFHKIWHGTGVGTSNNSDVRISTQFILDELISEFPISSTNNSNIQHTKSAFGISLGIFTADGNNYYPTVIEIDENSTAKQYGIKLHDMIINIDEYEMNNLPLSEVVSFFMVNPKTPLQLTVLRVDEKFRITIP